MIAAVFVSDRGDLYLPGCLDSFDRHVDVSLIGAHHIVDDSDHVLGMAGAVQAGFAWALDSGADYVFWIEEDFRFHQPLPLAGMRGVLETNPQLAQVVLKRQPWSAEERRYGGIIECCPDAYVQCDGFVVHQRIFSLNPCLIPRRVLELGWPSGDLGVGNESGFTDRCLAAGLSFAFYGRRFDPPLCEHVGAQRSGGWRL